MNSNIFKGYYDTLDEALDIFPLEMQTTLEFVRRGTKHSAVIYIRNDSEEIRKLIDTFLGKYGFTVPRNLYEPGPPGTRTGLIAIDLGTLNDDNLRIYVTTTHNKPANPDNTQWLWGIGYYLDREGNVAGKKHYNANIAEKTMEVEYFDSEGNVITSAGDVETISDDWTVWGGSESLYNSVKEAGLVYKISHKSKKDQGYFIVSLRKKLQQNC